MAPIKNKENNPWKKVFSLKMGQSFKGHGMSLTTCNLKSIPGCFDDKVITYSNTYYTSSVVSDYYIDKDETRTVISNFSKTPLYIVNVLDKLNDTWPNVIKEFKYSNGSILINATKDSIHVSNTITKTGINFMNHYENINKIKDLNSIIVKFKDRFKSGDKLEKLIRRKKDMCDFMPNNDYELLM